MMTRVVMDILIMLMLASKMFFENFLPLTRDGEGQVVDEGDLGCGQLFHSMEADKDIAVGVNQIAFFGFFDDICQTAIDGLRSVVDRMDRDPMGI